MTKDERRLRSAFPLALIVVSLAACSERVSPTESSSPTPPAPAASMSGTIRSYGSIASGTTIECQGKKTTTSTDGAYALDGLEAGPTTVHIAYAYETPKGLVTDAGDFDVVLDPGPNVKDFFVY
jgi:hypothetical protein